MIELFVSRRLAPVSLRTCLNLQGVMTKHGLRKTNTDSILYKAFHDLIDVLGATQDVYYDTPSISKEDSEHYLTNLANTDKTRSHPQPHQRISTNRANLLQQILLLATRKHYTLWLLVRSLVNLVSDFFTTSIISNRFKRSRLF